MMNLGYQVRDKVGVKMPELDVKETSRNRSRSKSVFTVYNTRKTGKLRDHCNLAGEMRDMPEKIVALKVDVDTYAGTRDGVPNMLADMARFGVKATFYFSMGPDNSGKAIRRIFTRPGFLKKMLRTRAPAAYGIKTMLYGTLLPAPMIAESYPHVLRETEQQGHEVGIHCWDHVKWHDYLPWFPKHLTAMELGRASALFEEILGHRATTTAAPGWTVSPDSLEVQDALGLACSNDGRGSAPFYPVMDVRRFHGHLSSQVRQQAVHIGLKPFHNGDANDAGHVVHGAHDIHPLVGLKDELEKDHVTVPDLEITEDHGITSP